MVLMEYMACGKPVIASYNSGHMDIVRRNNALLIECHKPMERRNGCTESSKNAIYERLPP